VVLVMFIVFSCVSWVRFGHHNYLPGGRNRQWAELTIDDQRLFHN